MKKLCLITNKYPNEFEPNVLVFVQQLVWEFADKGVECSVICPIPININPKYINLPYVSREKTSKNNEIDIYRPKYIGFGQSDILNYNPSKLTTNNFTSAVSRTIKKMDEKPSAVYGHFVTPAGIAAARIGIEFNIPSFMAYGEATFGTIEHFGVENTKKELSDLDGVVAVSTKNKNTLISAEIVEEDKIKVFPNGYRSDRFFPRNKIEAREKFNLPLDKFIVSFVGSYDNRKGINRLEEAVDKLDNVYFISAGKGDLEPTSDKCLYSGSVDNEDLPYFYSASDAFVLPTLNEGCSNAIVEAMACGLPIVSSNLPFNFDILNESNALLVKPDNIIELSNAIELLKNNNEIKENMGKNSLVIAKNLGLDTRANNIIDFIDSNIKS